MGDQPDHAEVMGDEDVAEAQLCLQVDQQRDWAFWAYSPVEFRQYEQNAQLAFDALGTGGRFVEYAAEAADLCVGVCQQSHDSLSGLRCSTCLFGRGSGSFNDAHQVRIGAVKHRPEGFELTP